MRNATKQFFDGYQMQFATTMRAKHLREIIENARNAEQDSDRVARLAKGLCKYCHYIHTTRIGGAAMTTVTCGVCQAEMTFGSTSTDALCLECARKHKLCKRCGADSELRTMRRDLKFAKEAEQAFNNSQIGHTPENSG
jgi:hypothetical protein